MFLKEHIDIGGLYTSKCIYVCIYIWLYSLIVIPPLAVVQCVFASPFIVFSVFPATFSVVHSYYRSVFFQYLLHVLFAFLGNTV